VDSLDTLSDNELFSAKTELENKISVFNTLQSSYKIIANSLYGAIGCPYFRFYDSDIASSITLSGQAAINTVEDVVTNYGIKLGDNGVPAIKMIAGDTDSGYFDITNLIKKLGATDKAKIVDVIDKFAGTKIQGVISDGVKKLTDKTNAYDPKLYMKRESISNAVLVAKKRFIFKVYDNEGVRYSEPELKVTGLGSQSSSTPKWIREKLKDAYWIFFEGSEKDLQKFVKETQAEFLQVDIVDVTAATTANNMHQYIVKGEPIKGTPFHLKAANVYNKMIVTKGLESKYPLIKSGDKIRLIPLVTPNPTKNQLIAVSDKIPPEFGLEQYVDRDAVLEKFFIGPLQKIADVVNWNCIKKYRLEL
jgi:DNA polymerase elongation subunit (family B)